MCGILGGLCVGLSQIHELAPLWVKIFALLGATFPNVGLLFSRDNNVSSEQANAKSGVSIPKVLPLILAVIAFAFVSVGCRNLAPDGPYKGDKLLYEADTVIVTSYDTLHTFVQWEHDNRQSLAAWPEIKISADVIRLRSRDWLTTAIAAREAYSVAPNADNRDKLTRAIAVLRSALNESVKYLNKNIDVPSRSTK